MVLWLMLAAIYLVLCFTLGLMTFRGRHYVLFVAGFFLPLIWLFGAFMEPRRA